MDNFFYIRGAAFYLFIYLFLGLINSGIAYLGAKVLHLNPVILLGLLILIAVSVLYTGFRQSIHLFFSKEVPDSNIVKAWIVQFVIFLVIAVGIESSLSRVIERQKLFQVISVFINFTTFFFSYWLSVKFFIGKKFTLCANRLRAPE
jgi:hypothetical protein